MGRRQLGGTLLCSLSSCIAVLTGACGGSLAGPNPSDVTVDASNMDAGDLETDAPVDADCNSMWCKGTFAEQLASASSYAGLECETATCGPYRAILQGSNGIEIECYYDRASGVLMGAWESEERVVGCNGGEIHNNCPSLVPRGGQCDADAGASP